MHNNLLNTAVFVWLRFEWDEGPSPGARQKTAIHLLRANPTTTHRHASQPPNVPHNTSALTKRAFPSGTHSRCSDVSPQPSHRPCFTVDSAITPAPQHPNHSLLKTAHPRRCGRYHRTNCLRKKRKATEVNFLTSPRSETTQPRRYRKHSLAQVSLEPLKPFRAIVEVIVKRKTGGGRWRYEVKVEATEAPPDDSISLKASVGGVSSAVFRLCNRYLGYAPFQVQRNGERRGKERATGDLSLSLLFVVSQGNVHVRCAQCLPLYFKFPPPAEDAFFSEVEPVAIALAQSDTVRTLR